MERLDGALAGAGHDDHARKERWAVALHAKQQLETFATQLQTTATKTGNALDSLSGSTSLTELGAKLAPLAPQLQVLAASAKSTVNSISATGTKLKEGFQDADSCKRFD